jgi:hypothetical protein
VGGKTLGKVEEFYFDTKTGKISGLDLSGSGNFLKDKVSVAGTYIITIAVNTLMIKDEALNHLHTRENSLLASVEEALGTVREKTAIAANITLEASKKLGQNIADSIAKIKASELSADAEIGTEQFEETYINEYNEYHDNFIEIDKIISTDVTVSEMPMEMPEESIIIDDSIPNF